MAYNAEPEIMAEIASALVDIFAPDVEICSRRKDGSASWASLLITPVLNENGTIVQHFASLADLTGCRRKNDRLQFLLDELNHRT